MKKRKDLVKIAKGVYQIPATKPGSHSYLFIGRDLKVLVDPGIVEAKTNLKKAFKKLGIKFSDIHMVINTHEHYDHISANIFFQDTAIIAAARSAASKINVQDEGTTLCKVRGADCHKLVVHLYLENITRINLGGLMLKIYITPAQSSGCLCVYEEVNQILFTGDTVFAKGTLPIITSSGSLGDYISSLERLLTIKIKSFYPGHGSPSLDVYKDLKLSLKNAKKKIVRDGKSL